MPARILIVEDNAANLKLVEYLLKAAGHRVSSATDGGEGVRMARKERPDLILCDLQIPVLDGYEVLQQLRSDAATRAIPIVAVTAFSAPGDQTKVIDAGFDGYLSKPIDPEKFVAQAEHYLPPGMRTGFPLNRR
ncbi:MAG TPA: response regulator [Burkholderiales bacterium]|nr:response regulator [Burkholderiales bacterium]